MITSHPLIDYPKKLDKKVLLLQHFKNYLEKDPKSILSEESQNTEVPKVNDVVYVKKWMKTRHAIMFRLSNKIVQVCFEDRTEIILNSENREVTYINKRNKRETYSLVNALESTNAEMTKRLKYTKEILTHMLTSNQQRYSNRTLLNDYRAN